MRKNHKNPRNLTKIRIFTEQSHPKNVLLLKEPKKGSACSFFTHPKPPRAHFSFCHPPTRFSTPRACPLLQNKATNCATKRSKTSAPLQKRHFLSPLKSFFDETNPISPARKNLLLIQLKPNPP